MNTPRILGRAVAHSHQTTSYIGQNYEEFGGGNDAVKADVTSTVDSFVFEDKDSPNLEIGLSKMADGTTSLYVSNREVGSTSSDDMSAYRVSATLDNVAGKDSLEERNTVLIGQQSGVNRVELEQSGPYTQVTASKPDGASSQFLIVDQGDGRQDILIRPTVFSDNLVDLG